MLQSAGSGSRSQSSFCGGPPFGELSGGNWMAREVLSLSFGSGGASGLGDRASVRPPTFETILGPPGGPFDGPGSVPGRQNTVVTWLILPVVICLSQRLSHACLSISNLYGETANGSLNQLSFI